MRPCAWRRLARLGLLLIGVVGRPLTAQGVGDLPLNELPTVSTGTAFVVFLTGDGGWVALDQKVSERLLARGIPVVGFNQREYLWARKTPEQAGADLGRIIAHYRSAWHKDSVVIVGYSRGAGTAPYAINRLPAAERARVKGVVLIGAEHGAGFQFHLRDVLRSGSSPDDIPVLPEVLKLGALPLMCVYGADEPDTICPELKPPAVLMKLSGGHHYDGAYAAIGERIVEVLFRR